MAITVGNTSSSGDPGTANTTYSWSHTCQSGTNRLVVLPRAHETIDADRPVSGVTYDGNALTKADSLQSDNLDFGAEVWYLNNPTTGSSLIIEVTHTGKTTEPCAGAIDLKGIDTGSTFEAVHKQAGGGASIALSVLTGDAVVATEVTSNLDATELGVTGGTQIESVDLGQYSGQSGYDLADLALTFTHTDQVDYCAILVSFNAGAGEVPLAGTSTAETTVAGSLKVSKELIGSAAVEATTDGVLKATREIAGSVAASSTAVAVGLKVTREIIGSADAVVTVTGTLKVAKELIGTAAATCAVADATLTVTVPTKLLLHFNGTDGSQAFEDSSDSNHTMGYVGTAQLDIDWKKFGPTSLLLPNGTNYITSADHADWDIGADNWTFEMWARWRVTPTGIRVGMFSRYKDADNGFRWFINNTGAMFIYCIVGGITKMQYEMSWVPTLETTYHLAIVRSGTSIYFFVNGVSQTLTETIAVGTNNLNIADEGITIGHEGFSDATLDGHIDEFRFSSVARWTSNFTPPTQQYEDIILIGTITTSSTAAASTLKLTKQLAGTVTASSTATATLETSTLLAGTSDATTSVAGTLKITKELIGSVAVVATVDGALTGVVLIAGTVDAVCTGTGTLKAARKLIGTIDSTCATTGDLQTVTLLAGTVDAQTTVTGALKATKELIGSVTSVCTVSGTLKATRKLIGTADVSTTVTGAIKSTKELIGTIDAAATAVGTLTLVGTILLEGTIDTSSTVTGVLKATRGLLSNTTAVVTVDGTLSAVVLLAGTIDSTCTTTATLQVYTALAGTITATSVVTGALKVTKKCVGSITAGVTVASWLGVIRPVAGSLAAQSTVVGVLTEPPELLVGSIAATSTATGTVQVFRMLTGTITAQSPVSGSLKVTKELIGTVVVTTTVAGTLEAGKELTGALAASSTVSGTLLSVSVLSSSVVCQSTVDGALALTKELVGATACQSSVIGTLRIKKELIGTITCQCIISGELYAPPPECIISGVQVSPIFVHGTRVNATLTKQRSYQLV